MHLDTERDLYQKIILGIHLAMAVIFAICIAVSRMNDGVLFRDALLEISQQGSTTVYSGTVYGTPVTITSREENGTKYVNISADGEYYANCRIEFPEGTIYTQFETEVGRIQIIRNEQVIFSGGYSIENDNFAEITFFNENGSWESHPGYDIYAYSGSNPWANFEFSVSNIIRFAGTPETTGYGSWGWYFMALFLAVIGALLTAYPNTVFFFEHFLSVQDPEPTDFYYFCHKVGSVLYVGITFFMYIKAVFTIV